MERLPLFFCFINPGIRVGHIRPGQIADVLSLTEAVFFFSCVAFSMWAARTREAKLLFLVGPKRKKKKKTVHNQSKPSPDPDDEIIIHLAWICCPPTHGSHTVDAMWQWELGATYFLPLNFIGKRGSNLAFRSTDKSVNVTAFEGTNICKIKTFFLFFFWRHTYQSCSGKWVQPCGEF